MVENQKFGRLAYGARKIFFVPEIEINKLIVEFMIQ